MTSIVPTPPDPHRCANHCGRVHP